MNSLGTVNKVDSPIELRDIPHFPVVSTVPVHECQHSLSRSCDNPVPRGRELHPICQQSTVDKANLCWVRSWGNQWPPVIWYEMNIWFDIYIYIFWLLWVGNAHQWGWTSIAIDTSIPPLWYPYGHGLNYSLRSASGLGPFSISKNQEITDIIHETKSPNHSACPRDLISSLVNSSTHPGSGWYAGGFHATISHAAADPSLPCKNFYKIIGLSGRNANWICKGFHILQKKEQWNWIFWFHLT